MPEILSGKEEITRGLVEGQGSRESFHGSKASTQNSQVDNPSTPKNNVHEALFKPNKILRQGWRSDNL